MTDTMTTTAPIIILVHPQLVENIGMTARAMANCALTELRIVAPRDPWPLGEVHRQRMMAASSGADDILENAKLFDSVQDAIADLNHVYATTSHSMNNDGERRPDREQMLRFRIEGNAAGQIASYTKLRDDLMAADDLKAAIRELSGEEVDFEKLNIEGLSYYREAGHLLVGLREPMGVVAQH